MSTIVIARRIAVALGALAVAGAALFTYLADGGKKPYAEGIPAICQMRPRPPVLPPECFGLPG